MTYYSIEQADLEVVLGTKSFRGWGGGGYNLNLIFFVLSGNCK